MTTPNDPSSSVRASSELVAGARCAQHLEVTATAVCARCGNFMCSACSMGGTAKWCSSCRERTGASSFPFSRDRFELSALLAYSWARFKAQWQVLVLSSLAFLGIVYGLAFAGGVVAALLGGLAAGSDPQRAKVAAIPVQVAMQALQIVLQMWLQLGFFAVVFDVLEGRTAQIGTLFSRLGRLPALFLQLLIVYLAIAVLFAPPLIAYFVIGADSPLRMQIAVGIGAVLFFPWLYLGLGAAFAMLELTYDPSSSALSALRASFRMVQGHRWVVIGSALLSAVITLAGVIACCVGLVPAYGLAILLYGSLFLALRTPTVQ